MKESWHDLYLNIIQKKHRGIFSTCLRGILLFLSWLFQGIVTARNWTYDKKIFPIHRCPIPVISIGNITAGGSGKTPTTLLLARLFHPHLPIAILSRGYHSPAEKLNQPLILSKGSGPLCPAAYCGDEPYLLSKNLPEAWVIVGKDRIAASKIASEGGVKLILLDDGMQHRKLARDLEVVTINAKNPFGLGYSLPRGLLREKLSSLKRANLIILNNIQDHSHFIALKKQVTPFSSAPVVGSQIQTLGIWSEEKDIAAKIKNKKVAIFCAIAHPEQFQATVQKNGAIPVAKQFLPDHQKFEIDQLKLFAKESQKLGAEWIICTEKDFVKLPQISDLALPIAWLQIELCITEGNPHWENFLTSAKNLIKNNEP